MTRLPHRIIGFLILAAAAWADCPAGLMGTTANFAADQLGQMDSRPGSAGTLADYKLVQIPFTNVPAGCRVQIVEVHADFVAWPLPVPTDYNKTGQVPPGTQAGVLVSAGRTSALIGGGSTRANNAADGYVFYRQQCTSGPPASITIDHKVVEGTLDADNVLQIKISEWMNRTGLTIHMELTISQIVFQYVAQGGEGR